MIPLRFCLTAALMLAPVVGRGQVVLSNFNLDADGWLAYAGADSTTAVAYSMTSGTGGSGAIVLQEPANGLNDYFTAPSKFLGDRSAFYGGTLSFDLKLSPSWDGSSEAAMVILTGTYNGSALAIGYLPPNGQYPNGTSFTTFTLSLNTATAWSLTNSTDFVTGTLATPAQVQGILGTLSSLRILGDWTNTVDRDILDNVTMTAVPEPGMLSAVAGVTALVFAMWRRCRKHHIGDALR